MIIKSNKNSLIKRLKEMVKDKGVHPLNSIWAVFIGCSSGALLVHALIPDLPLEKGFAIVWNMFILVLCYYFLNKSKLKQMIYMDKDELKAYHKWKKENENK